MNEISYPDGTVLQVHVSKFPSQGSILALSRWEYSVAMWNKDHWQTATLVAGAATQKMLQDSSPHKGNMPEKEILWSFAPRMARNIAEINSADANLITKRLREDFCNPNYNFAIHVEPAVDGEEASAQDDLSQLSYKLPGMSIKVACPVDKCADKIFARGAMQLRNVIMHLNDQHQYPRADIADWLDELYAAGVPLAFEDNK